MKNNENEPKEYFERNILFVMLCIGAGIICDWLSFYLLKKVNPWGTAFIVPGFLLTLQGLWLLVHPYAILFDDRLEIKQNFIYNKEIYYLDSNGVENTKSKLRLIYNDGEKTVLPLRGMRSSHKLTFENKLAEKIKLSLTNRIF